MKNTTGYDYQTSWGKHAFEEEDCRFLKNSEEDLQKICDCIDLNDPDRPKTSGGIPVHYENGRLYVLKEGPHTRVCGESGSKKSRTICRGALISAVKNGDSTILNDPKGEISGDPKIQALLREQNVNVYILDFQNFDKDGFNCLAHAYKLAQNGDMSRACTLLDSFVNMTVEKNKGGDDPFWNSSASNLINFAAKILLRALLQLLNGEESFHLTSVKSFIRQDRELMRAILAQLRSGSSNQLLHDPVDGFAEILENLERTYACVVQSANALLSAFCSSENILNMLSIQTFDLRSFYEQSSVLFLVVPDERKTYGMVVGYLIDTFYQILVEEYGDVYQDRRQPPCSIKFVCDEAASIYINDMSSKISASRSHQIDWTLIYQSDRQMQKAYPDDFAIICGNAKNYIFLGSSDPEMLAAVSSQAGTTRIAPGGRADPLVSVDDLRRMRKEKEFKDTLLITGNHLYVAKLPDYDIYSFLKNQPARLWSTYIKQANLHVFTPEELLERVKRGEVALYEEKSRGLAEEEPLRKICLNKEDCCMLPNIKRITKIGPEVVDLFTYCFMETRSIWLLGEVNDRTATEICLQLEYLDSIGARTFCCISTAPAVR